MIWAVKLFGWFAGKREWLMLLALVLLAGWFYADSRRARADRDAWASWGGEVCGFAGAGTAAATVEVETDKGKRRVKKARGELCRDAVRDLASFRSQTLSKTADVLANAQIERERKTGADLTAAKRDGADRGRVVENMETLDGKVSDDDRVDGNWFAGLNDLGGLH